ncbi:MAG: hypothetical protein ACPGUZ_04040 [Holosporaceae bacterium]
MFSYSKRLALLLTVCGTLLNTSPLLAAKDGATTKSSWFKPWTWGKKKDNKPKETKEDLLQQVNKRLASIGKLKKEFSQSQEVLLNASMSEKNKEKREKLSKSYTQNKAVEQQLTNWGLTLANDQYLLEKLQTKRPEKIAEIEQHIKESGGFINKTYGRKRRVKSWFGKKFSRTNNTTQPAEQDTSSAPTSTQPVSTEKDDDVFEDATENLQS